VGAGCRVSAITVYRQAPCSIVLCRCHVQNCSGARIVRYIHPQLGTSTAMLILCRDRLRLLATSWRLHTTTARKCSQMSAIPLALWEPRGAAQMSTATCRDRWISSTRRWARPWGEAQVRLQSLAVVDCVPCRHSCCCLHRHRSLSRLVVGCHLVDCIIMRSVAPHFDLCNGCLALCLVDHALYSNRSIGDAQVATQPARLTLLRCCVSAAGPTCSVTRLRPARWQPASQCLTC
jgi:hypothetical protein